MACRPDMCFLQRGIGNDPAELVRLKPVGMDTVVVSTGNNTYTIHGNDNVKLMYTRALRLCFTHEGSQVELIMEPFICNTYSEAPASQWLLYPTVIGAPVPAGMLLMQQDMIRGFGLDHVGHARTPGQPPEAVTIMNNENYLQTLSGAYPGHLVIQYPNSVGTHNVQRARITVDCLPYSGITGEGDIYWDYKDTRLTYSVAFENGLHIYIRVPARRRLLQALADKSRESTEESQYASWLLQLIIDTENDGLKTIKGREDQ